MASNCKPGIEEPPKAYIMLASILIGKFPPFPTSPAILNFSK